MADEPAVEGVGAELRGILVPPAGVRALAVVLISVAIAAPWLASWSELLQFDMRASVQSADEIDVVRLRPELVLLPGGRFMMGSAEDEPSRDSDESLHDVELSPFYICRTEVTNAQWRAVTAIPRSDCNYGCDDDHPAQSVSWELATEYLNQLTDRENLLLAPDERLTRCYEGRGNATWVAGCTGYRLPTEAEWEYAARAGTRTAYSFGDDPKDLCTYGNGADQSAVREHPDWAERSGDCDDGAADLAKVGTYPTNAWGLFDMHGNVTEWTWDWYASDDVEDENGQVTRDPRGPLNGSHRVLRGGSFANVPGALRSAVRDWGDPARSSELTGFRCARSAPGLPADSAGSNAPPTQPTESLDSATEPPPTEKPAVPTPSSPGKPGTAAAADISKPFPKEATRQPEVLVLDGGSLEGEPPRPFLAEKMLPYLDSIRACYSRALARNPFAQGGTTVRYTIASSGNVTSADIEFSTIRDPEFDRCLLEVFRSMAFSQYEEGGSVVATQVLGFRPGDGPAAKAPSP